MLKSENRESLTMRELNVDEFDQVGGGTLNIGPVLGITASLGSSVQIHVPPSLNIDLPPPPPAIANLVAGIVGLL